MTREEYLTYRNKGSLVILYEYYKENYKGNQPLEPQIFFQAIVQWPFRQQAYALISREYDIKYEITLVQDLKTGQILKYL